MADAPAEVFLARGLEQQDGAALAEEGISGVRAHPWAEVRQMVRDGTISDSETVGALMLGAIELGWV